MKRRKGLLLGLASLVMTHASSVMAAPVLLAEYTFDLADIAADGKSASATSTFGSIDAGDITFGPSSSVSGTPLFETSGAVVRSSETSSTNDLLSEALAGSGFSEYLSFTIDSTSASPFSISKISYDYEITSASGLVLSTHLLLNDDGDAFSAADLLKTTQLTPANPLSTADAEVTYDLALTGLTAPVEIRIYFSDTSVSGAGIHGVSNIKIEGVPEPSSLALLGLGGICLLRRRRSRTV